METPFRALKLFAAIYVIIGFLLLTGSVVALLTTLGVLGETDNHVASLLTGYYGTILIIGLFMAGLTSVAYGQFIQVVMQIEENTRK
jgi:hypothetical protein